MRDQGRLVEWFDEKGYGFIQPDDMNKERVFLHISDFARKGPRPLVGCWLDTCGRARADLFWLVFPMGLAAHFLRKPRSAITDHHAR